MSECVSNRRCVASQAACKRLPPQPRGRCCVASQAARIGAVSQAPQLLSRVAFFRVSVAVLWRAECIGDDASSDTPSRGPATEDPSLVENSLFTVTYRVTKAIARTIDGRQEYSPLHIFRPPPKPSHPNTTHARTGSRIATSTLAELRRRRRQRGYLAQTAPGGRSRSDGWAGLSHRMAWLGWIEPLYGALARLDGSSLPCSWSLWYFWFS